MITVYLATASPIEATYPPKYGDISTKYGEIRTSSESVDATQSKCKPLTLLRSGTPRYPYPLSPSWH